MGTSLKQFRVIEEINETATNGKTENHL